MNCKTFPLTFIAALTRLSERFLLSPGEHDPTCHPSASLETYIPTMAAPTVYPANPFKKPGVFFKCPKVTSIYTLEDETLQACQKVVAAKQKPPHIKLDDSLHWYDTAREQRSIIETGRDELQKKDAENHRNAVLIIKDIQNIDADCAATSSRIGEREKEQKRLELKKVENVQTALTRRCMAVGYEQVLQILKSLSGTRAVTPTQDHVVDQTPAALVRAFRLHLNASEENVRTRFVSGRECRKANQRFTRQSGSSQSNRSARRVKFPWSLAQ